MVAKLDMLNSKPVIPFGLRGYVTILNQEVVSSNLPAVNGVCDPQQIWSSTPLKFKTRLKDEVSQLTCGNTGQ